jgi:hypothetical protein
MAHLTQIVHANARPDGKVLIVIHQIAPENHVLMVYSMPIATVYVHLVG